MFGYQINGDTLYLYKVIDGIWDAPNEAVTDGIKIEYSDGGVMFVDSDGVEVAEPDEDSIINVSESLALAMADYVKSKIVQDIRESEYFYQRFLGRLSRAKHATGYKPVAIPQRPYSFRS